MSKVPVDTNSPQYRIWHDRFSCRMKAIDSMSVDYIRIFGTLTSGDTVLDRQMHDEDVHRYMTIIDMIKNFSNGVRVVINRNEDCKTIYILIQQHLQNWNKELQVSLRPDSAPLEELEIMDRFADAVYEHAKWYLDSALVDTPFARTLRQDNRSVLSLLRKPEQAAVEDSDMIVHPKRASMSDVFTAGMAKLERKY